jgi:heavy metal sensor kinase
MNPRSIRFRLIVWYSGVLLLVIVGFGVLTYINLRVLLTQELKTALDHRARQIGGLLMSKAALSDPDYVRREIESRYDPAQNDKFVRITGSGGKVLYLSKRPTDGSFVPADVPFWPSPVVTGASRVVTTVSGDRLQISLLQVATKQGTSNIEVGASLFPSARVLDRLLATLLNGLPVVLGIVIFGGYVLLKRALAPVQALMTAAEDISLHNLTRRLPVLKSNDEIASLSTVLNQMIARLDESFQHTVRFTADASHELRTPLTIVRGELETLLRRSDLTPEVNERLLDLLEEVERLSGIVKALLALARLDTGEAQHERERLHLGRLVESTTEQMALLAEEKNIRLTRDVDSGTEVEGDKTRVQQVIVNLLDNAIKYTPNGGSVQLSVRADEHWAVLEVSDSGPGIPPVALPHIFERFYRVDQGRSRSVDGAGLGLSIVHSICVAHGGSVTAENREAGGSRFTVKLPKVH